MTMLFSAENILLVGSILLFVSIVVSKTGYRFGVPALLLFLIVGMTFGSDGLGLQFSDSSQAQFIGMVALSVILFSGGMDTKFVEIKPIVWPGVVLSTLGVFLTAIFTGLFIWFITGMSFTNVHLPIMTSLLLAATMSSTDSASVFAILRSQKMNMKHNLRPMLELESGSNDPMAYMMTIVFIQVIQSEGMNLGMILGSFVIQFIVGAGAGYLFGKLAIKLLNKIEIDNKAFYPILLLAFVFFTFSFTDKIHGNGYLAVYILGIMVGNYKIPFRKDTATIMDGLSWLCQIVMFISLGLLVNPLDLLDIALVASLVGVFMIIIGRPLSVFLCLLPFKNVNMRSRVFISWVGLRGAVPIIFATYPVVAGVEGSNIIFNIVFFITILSLVIQGTTIPFVARLLHLSTPLEKTGNEFGIELPEEINSNLSEITVTQEMHDKADTLKEMDLPDATLVMIVKRGDEFLVPNGSLKLHVGDKLLLISENEKKTQDTLI